MMSHWAEINENSIVLRVLVGNNDELDEGYQWLIDNLGGTWIKTSVNTHEGVHALGGIPLRKNYAGVGYIYDSVRDAFISPKPLESFVLNEETCNWEPPITKPNDGKRYRWDEETTSWVEIELAP